MNSCRDFQNTLSTQCNITTPGGFHFESRRQHQSATLQYTQLNATTNATETPAKDLISFAVWRPLVIGQLDEFEVFECRLSLAAYIYTNITVSQNTLHIQDETTVPLELIGSANAKLNYFKPAVGNFPQGLSFAVHGADLTEINHSLSTIFNVDAMYPFGGGQRGLAADVLIKGNISQIVDTIAWDMTEQIRTGPNSTVSPGVAFQSQTYIDVNWPWITLPVLVVLGAATLLVCAMVVNFRCRTALWKSSSLAMLLHSSEGVRDCGIRAEWDNASIAGIDAFAEKLRVERVGDMEFVHR